MDKALIKWACQELSDLLKSEASEDIITYLLSIEDKNELQEYVHDLVGFDNEQVQDFVQDLLIRKTTHLKNISVYQKSKNYGDENTSKDVKPKRKKEPRNKNVFSEIHNMNSPKTPLDRDTEISESSETSDASLSPSKKQKKTQYVSLYSKEGEHKTNAVLLPGRHPCECQAQKHRLINNCLNCGRVVCLQENSGPCLFCGELVCTQEERQALLKDSNKSEKLYNKLMNKDGGKTLQIDMSEASTKANEYKNRLLDYDRTYAQRTKVIDDESDYYAIDSNVWLSEKERNLVKKREKEKREERFGSRLNRKFTLDFAGRRVIEDEVGMDMYEADILSSNYSAPKQLENLHISDKNDNTFVEDNSLINPHFKDKAPKYIPVSKERDNNMPKSKIPHSGILQDKTFQEMSDRGMCLSMHQPWATLLIKGIKMHEGRTWYSNHRGRLWIAAAAHEPSSDEINQVERMYEYNGKKPNGGFPTEYPTKCLLGCVTVTDVLSQEEYQEIYPDGESNSPFVFICQDPMELLVKFPLSGKHKIWRLPPQVHKASKLNLLIK